jgi:hypothetical protein
VINNGGGSISVLESVIGPLAARTIDPGHGPVCGPEVVDATLGYLRFVQAVAVRGVEAGLSPLDAARETDLGDYAQWSGTERKVGNLHIAPTPGARRQARCAGRRAARVPRDGHLQRGQAAHLPRLIMTVVPSPIRSTLRRR